MNMWTTSAPILLLGSGPVSKENIELSNTYTSSIVAVDGGARHVAQVGRPCEFVIGDMDSIVQFDLKNMESVPQKRVLDQETTDFEKALGHICAPMILGLGFLGWRLDHTLAAMTALATFPHQRCVLLGEEDVVFLLPEAFEIDLPLGVRISLFPMGPSRARSCGLKWALNGKCFAPDAKIATSNEVSGPVSIGLETGNFVVMVPKRHLAAVWSALTPAF
ncbi:MAG: thiamine diphosphokinase [Halocynthiibacter sp.]